MPAAIPIAIGAGAATAGKMGVEKLFGGDKGGEQVHPQLRQTPGQMAGEGFLMNLLEQGYPGAYEGQMFAPFPYQQDLSGLLGGYIGREDQPLYGEAQQELMRTLTGDYDPATSDYYQSFRDQALREEQEAVSRLRQGGVATGMLHSTPYVGGEARLRGDTASTLAQLLGRMSEDERARRLGAVPQAMQTGQFMEEAPLRTSQAIMGISPLLQQLEERPMAWEHEQWREERDWPYAQQAQLAQMLLGQAGQWEYPMYTQQQQGIGGILGNILGPAVGQGIGGLFGPRSGPTQLDTARAGSYPAWASAYGY